MGSFIQQFRLHRTTKDSTVVCAIPTARRGAINVLIGANNAGKTYTLESLRHALDTTKVNKAERILELSFTEERKPRFIYLGNNSVHMNKVGQGIDPFVRDAKIGHPRDIPNYRRALQGLLFDMMDSVVPGLRDEFAQGDQTTKKTLLQQFPAVSPLFLCRQDHTVIAELQSLLQGTLYFRRSISGAQDLFEFLLAYDDAGPVPFAQWSDGQKLIFLAVCLIRLEGMDVVFVDEIENHLHPQRISEFLQILSSAGVQAFVATHHPHVMLSEYVDRVFFVEQLCAPLHEPPPQLRRETTQDFVIPRRRFTELRDDFARIEHLYRLFDQHDQQLLKLASRITKEVDLRLYDAIRNAITPLPAPPSRQVKPDLQSVQLTKALAGMGTSRPVRILDLGAGIGRVAQELGKTGEDIAWECWEPHAATRDTLRRELAPLPICARVLDDLAEIADGSMDISLLANVLHELTPDAIGALLDLACRKLHAEGKVIILELHPLLAVEYYAVPYDAADLTEILASVGFTYDAQSYLVRGRVTTAHCIVAAPKRTITPEAVTESVLARWKQMKLRSLGFWANKKAVRTFDEYKDVLQHMTTIASISAYEAGLWRTG